MRLNAPSRCYVATGTISSMTACWCANGQRPSRFCRFAGKKTICRQHAVSPGFSHASPASQVDLCRTVCLPVSEQLQRTSLFRNGESNTVNAPFPPHNAATSRMRSQLLPLMTTHASRFRCFHAGLPNCNEWKHPFSRTWNVVEERRHLDRLLTYAASFSLWWERSYIIEDNCTYPSG